MCEMKKQRRKYLGLLGETCLFLLGSCRFLIQMFVNLSRIFIKQNHPNQRKTAPDNKPNEFNKNLTKKSSQSPLAGVFCRTLNVECTVCLGVVSLMVAYLRVYLLERAKYNIMLFLTNKSY